jgi:hypothetical protein
MVQTVVADDVSLHQEAAVHFASVAEGQELLAARDRFISSLSPFDRQSRVETDREVSEAAFLEFVSSHVRAWSPEESTKLSKVIESLRPKLAELRLPLPNSIWLIKTTGREEGDAAYCRKHAIVLPQSKVDDPPQALERLLTHELFHILSSHDSKLREKCYKLIGFRVIPPVDFPALLRDRKLTNPDGPLADALIDVKVGNETISVVPILYSSAERFDPVRGGPFFKYLTFRLLVVESQEGNWRPTEQNGQPRLLSPNQTPDYGRQIGTNTGYVIHPDEILAENFVHLVQGTQNLRSPEIVSGLKEALRN